MVQLNRKDYEFFWKLSSAYHALSSSACDPVVLPSDLVRSMPLETVPGIFARQFYDTLDDEEAALKEMFSRFDNASLDISKHFASHHFLQQHLSRIEVQTNFGDRSDISSTTHKLIMEMQEQAKSIKSHQEKLGINSFLFYPTCLPGHYFMVQGTPIIAQNCFNPSQSEQGYLTEIRTLDDLRVEFNRRKEPLGRLNLFDNSYSEMNRATALLLDRASAAYRAR